MFFKDHSTFVTATSFEYIVYDETDDPDSMQGLWPFPGSNTGVIFIDSNKATVKIEGHYYRVWTSN